LPDLFLWCIEVASVKGRILFAKVVTAEISAAIIVPQINADPESLRRGLLPVIEANPNLSRGLAFTTKVVHEFVMNVSMSSWGLLLY